VNRIVVTTFFVALLTSACRFDGSCNLSSTKIDSLDASIVADDPVPDATAVTTDVACPANMQHVIGEFCPEVEQECSVWLSGDHPQIGKLRCAEFSSSKCVAKKRRHLDFCMDTYEWPNVKGQSPPVGVTWHEAKSACEKVGKRLCTASEWTFACEGEEVKPYPYGDGMHRDDTACNIDKESMKNPDAPRSEWPANYRAVPSGSMERCVSWSGVHDMTGNVDEWVHNVGGRSDGDPYYSGLKGGYWGQVRSRCRPMTTVHGPGFAFYQIGFRCCADVGAK